jgi:hypothetical protein
MPKSQILAVALACLIAGVPATADDIRPLSDARPMADEKCIEQCDIKSDECMQGADGDPGKLKLCDDKYSECLQACETG